jgi:DNA-binding SARP family transcriptional activator
METLRIHLFGPLRVYRTEKLVTDLPTHQAQRLLGYLLLYRSQVHFRSTLSSLFWGDSPEEQARKCLRTTLWRLRSFLEPDAMSKGTYLVVANDEICFSARDRCWLDVEEFEYRLARLPPIEAIDTGARPTEHELIGNLAKAVELYQGDLLEGWHDEWLLYERERLQGMFLNALRLLMTCHHSQGSYETALRYGQRILRYDPLLEAVHREMMRLHCLAGNRALALRQYHLCKEILAKELEIEPMEETTNVYKQIRQSETVGSGRNQAPTIHPRVASGHPDAQKDRLRPTELPLTSHVEEALIELKLVQAEFEHLSPRFERVVQSLDTIRQELRNTGHIA